ncbi:molybdopterin cofactor-binding domain-containing protein [Actinomycetes bacterium KLBMP 9759]
MPGSTTERPRGGQHRTVQPSLRETTFGRRRFLAYVVAGSTLTIAAKLGVDTITAADASAQIPSPPQLLDIQDLGDILILAGKPTEHLVRLEITEDGRAVLELPRAEVGQGLTTAFAMLVAEELDLPLDMVDVTLADARPELLFNQLTGGSNSVRSMYGPVRAAAAAARSRLLAAAQELWGAAPEDLFTEAGKVLNKDARTAGFSSLTALAAAMPVDRIVAQPKPPSEFTLVGTPTRRKDARAIVTGKQVYTLDLDIPGATPTMVRRPPTVLGSVKAVLNESQVRAMPGIIDIAVVPTGVAVLAETFGQALDGKQALRVEWNGGTIDGRNDEDIKQELRAATLPAAVPPLVGGLEEEFDFAFVSHAPLETNCAIADVREDSAEIWSGMKSPIVAQQTISSELGIPHDNITLHVRQAGGSFGRRLYWDGAIEAAHISKATGRVVKLMWSRIDDMRHGRMRVRTHHNIRATFAAGNVLSFEHRVATPVTDWSHGLGEILTSVGAQLPGGNLTFTETVFTFTVKMPYNFGATTQLILETPTRMNTAAWRGVYSPNTRGAEEIMVDEIAASLGKDPYEFRMEHLKEDSYREVLSKVAEVGNWGRSMPAGHAQGIAFHEEYRSCTACLVEMDATDPQNPRVTKAVIAGDYGLPINPMGLKAQLLGGLTDAISTTLRAGLHIEDGLPLEGSYSQFHYARQKDTPTDVEIFIMPGDRDTPGGAGELGVSAPVGAIANAYARATGTKPRSFPIIFPVDFEPFER